MDLITQLALGFKVALTPQNLAYGFLGVRARHADRRAAGAWAGGDHLHPAAHHLRAAGRRRP